jgi:hypothetical protein
MSTKQELAKRKADDAVRRYRELCNLPAEAREKYMRFRQDVDALPANAVVLKYDGQKNIWHCKGSSMDLTGTLMACLGHKMAHGWVKFVNKEATDRKISWIYDDLPLREELGDMDQSKWLPGLDGKPQNPWLLSYYVPLYDLETKTQFVWITNNKGGKAEVKNIRGLFAGGLRDNPPECLMVPVVELQGREIHTKFGSTVFWPQLWVDRWVPVEEIAKLDSEDAASNGEPEILRPETTPEREIKDRHSPEEKAAKARAAAKRSGPEPKGSSSFDNDLPI